jgi:ribosomal subunit interface protein
LTVLIEKNMPIEKKQAIRIMFSGADPDKKAQEYVEKKLQKINQLSKNILEFEVEIDRSKKGEYRVELMAKTARKLYRAEDISESVEASTDIACDELATQIVKDKDKIKDLKRRGARSIKKKIVIDKGARF